VWDRGKVRAEQTVEGRESQQGARGPCKRAYTTRHTHYTGEVTPTILLRWDLPQDTCLASDASQAHPISIFRKIVLRVYNHHQYLLPAFQSQFPVPTKYSCNNELNTTGPNPTQSSLGKSTTSTRRADPTSWKCTWYWFTCRAVQ